MTGFGRGVQKTKAGHFVVEVKSVNNRYCEVKIQAPKDLLELEHRLTEKIKEGFGRGKFEVQLKMEKNRNGLDKSVPEGKILKTWKDLESIRKKLHLKEITSLNQVIPFLNGANEEKETDRDFQFKSFLQAAEEALVELKSFRKIEGEKLCKDLKERVQVLEKCTKKIETQTETTARQRLEKLKGRVSLLLDGNSISAEKLDQELAFLADKCDVSEEVVRLKSHLKDLSTSLKTTEPVGRKIDFLIQEIHREVNTIGSKAVELEATDIVIEMKTEIERIREQAQNIE